MMETGSLYMEDEYPYAINQGRVEKVQGTIMVGVIEGQGGPVRNGGERFEFF